MSSQRLSKKDWLKVKRLFVASQPRRTFENGRVSFVRAEKEEGYMDVPRHLLYLGIQFFADDDVRCQCFCGSPYAEYNPENRRFKCPKGRSGCGKNWVDVVRLTADFVVEGRRPKPNLLEQPLPNLTFHHATH